MSNGFGTNDKKNVEDLIKQIDAKIKAIRSDFNKDVTILKNQLISCSLELNTLKELIQDVTEYTTAEYEKLERKTTEFEAELEDIKSRLNTIQYNEIAGGKCASGINEYPIYSRYAEKDVNGNDIPATYATKNELGSVSSTLQDDYMQKIAASSSAGMSALSSVSGQLTNSISEECLRATNVEQELDSKIDTETEERRIECDVLEDSIEAETTARENADSELQTSILEEETSRINADDTLQTNLDNEITRATNKEEELEQKIDDNYTTLDTALSAEITRANEAESLLNDYINTVVDDTNAAISGILDDLDSVSGSLYNTISNETTRATNEETRIAGLLGEEIVNRENALINLSNELGTMIGDEETARISTDNVLSGNIENEATSRYNADFDLSGKILEEYNRAIDEESRIEGKLDTEILDRTSADNNLQSQIDTIEATQNVVDIVGTKADLDLYDTSKLKVNDKIQVLEDETQQNATTIYSWNGNFSLVGTLGPYYTKSEVNGLTGNLNEFIVAETSRATSAENELYTQLDSVSGNIMNELTTTATNITNTITSLSSTVDDIFESVSGVVDTKFINTSSYINEVSGIFETKIENTNSYIDEVSGAAQTQFSNVNDELTNLYETKQDVLSAGDGIDITNDVVSHSIKIIENNDQEDYIEDTIMNVYLKNNHYKIITLDPTVTEIHFWVTKTESNVLQETGFEFQVPENSVLNDLEFRIIDDEQEVYTIIPKSYKTPNIYQGTIVNYKCTIGEYKVE